jgi:hypothetical protein
VTWLEIHLSTRGLPDQDPLWAQDQHHLLNHALLLHHLLDRDLLVFVKFTY